ncbi:MAG: hypothetical protein HZB19_02700 [Chloroflexi bacterium]|nr:hypothetical protein [Chloroflexota bacterium]
MAAKSSDSKVYRYNLALPKELFDELKEAADERGMSVVETLRKFIKLGLLALETQDKPGSALIIREGDTERQIMML